MLRVVYAERSVFYCCYAEWQYAECHYDERRYTECDCTLLLGFSLALYSLNIIKPVSHFHPSLMYVGKAKSLPIEWSPLAAVFFIQQDPSLSSFQKLPIDLS